MLQQFRTIFTVLLAALLLVGQAFPVLAQDNDTPTALPRLDLPMTDTPAEPVASSGDEAVAFSATRHDPLVGSVYQADYVIGAGDSIYVEDATMGELMKDGKILADGSVHFPLLGKVYLGGLSVREAKQLLKEKYAKYYVEPKITLQVTKQRPVRVYVLGAVAHPGVYVSGKNLSPQAIDRAQLGNYSSLLWFYRLYLADALVMAGGLTHNANVKDIKIHRHFPKPMTIHVNLMELFSNGNIIQDLPLRDQDVVEVAALPDNALVMDEAWEQFSENNINYQNFRVTVMGAVTHPGAYDVKSKDNVLTAVSKAGGFTDLAHKDKIYLLRTTQAGQIIKRELNMKDKKMIGNKPFEVWAALLPNDVVFVDESNSKKAAKFGTGLFSRASSAALFPFFNNMFRDNN